MAHLSWLEDARTHHNFKPDPIDDAVLETIYNASKWGPTSANCSPLRIVFIRTSEAKEHLKSALYEGNVEQTMQAPVTALFAYDALYYEKLTELFPHMPAARSWFEGPESDSIALRNSSLQAAYFMMAARAHGIDCGPMSGFDSATLKQTFLSNTTWEPNFLCNLGYGVSETLHARLPRLSVNEACRFE